MDFAHDPFLYPMPHSGFTNEWLDFDNPYDFPSGYVDDMQRSMGCSTTPDHGLIDPGPFDLDGFNSEFLSYGPQLLPDLSALDTCNYGYIDPIQNPSYSLDKPPEDSPEPGAFEPPIEDATLQDAPFYCPSTMRQAVETKASMDARCVSRKEKRLEAAIAVHLQRLQDVVAADKYVSSESSTSTSSPCWSEFVQESPSPQPPPTYSTNTPSPASASPDNGSLGADSTAGGVEMVLDLNMNAATNLPKKQKPRSLAQKENYAKARRYGACEKHRKQHKRCNCLEKSDTSRVRSVTQLPTTATTTTLARPSLTNQSVQSPSRRLSVKSSTVPARNASPNSPQVIPSANRDLRGNQTFLVPGSAYSDHTVPQVNANYTKHSCHASDVSGRASQLMPRPRPQCRTEQPQSLFDRAHSTPCICSASSSRPSHSCSEVPRKDESGKTVGMSSAARFSLRSSSRVPPQSGSSGTISLPSTTRVSLRSCSRTPPQGGSGRKLGVPSTNQDQPGTSAEPMFGDGRVAYRSTRFAPRNSARNQPVDSLLGTFSLAVSATRVAFETCMSAGYARAVTRRAVEHIVISVKTWYQSSWTAFLAQISTYLGRSILALNRQF